MGQLIIVVKRFHKPSKGLMPTSMHFADINTDKYRILMNGAVTGKIPASGSARDVSSSGLLKRWGHHGTL